MDPALYSSNELKIAACLVNGINALNLEGSLTVDEGATQSYTSTEAKFVEHSKLENEELKHLHVQVTLNSGIIALPARNCQETTLDLVVCILRKFKLITDPEFGELDHLFFLKNQLECEIPKICCEGFEFVSFDNERLSSLDRDQAAKKKFVAFIPASYRFAKSDQSEGDL